MRDLSRGLYLKLNSYVGVLAVYRVHVFHTQQARVILINSKVYRAERYNLGAI